ncbi:MAG: ATP-binding protein [Alphaproteobacteria bacterium]
METILEHLEPYLRRLVPTLIIAFLGVLGTGVVLQTINGRNEALHDTANELALIAAAIDDDLNHRIRTEPGDLTTIVQSVLDLGVPPATLLLGRTTYVTDIGGTIVAALPRSETRGAIGRKLDAVLGLPEKQGIVAPSPRISPTTILEESDDVMVVRPLVLPLGRLIIVQPKAEALANWRRSSFLLAGLFATTSITLLILGLAFQIQTARAHAGDLINRHARNTIDAALDAGRCGLWDWQIGARQIYWSPSMFELLGLEPRDELVDFAELEPLMHPDDHHVATLSDALAADPWRAIDLRFRMRHAKGHWIWLNVSGKRLADESADTLRVVGIAVDVTDQILQTEKSDAADKRIREAIEIISEAFVVCDDEERIVVSNTKFRQLNGLTESDAIPGRCYHEALARGTGPKVMEGRIVEPETPEGSRTLEVRLADSRWLQISERRTDCGGFVSVGTDITTLKRHESELLASQQRLKATVEDLRRSQYALEMQTQQLAELAEKYSEQKNRAEEANRAKSEFLANMSHELRTPLNAVIGFSEILKDGHFGPLGVPRYVEYARDIHDSGRFLLTVIDDILDMSKIEAGRLRISPETIRLDETLDEALRVIAKMASDRNIHVNSAVPDGLSLFADRRAIKQIALNLLSNAVKFTPPGGTISIKARKNRGHILIAIEDSGVGIPRAALHQLGRPFEQVDNALSRANKGSGLGLAIAKSLAELHGGSLRIRSAEGRGTTVFIRLPEHNDLQVSAAA